MFYFYFVSVHAHTQVLDRPGTSDLSAWVDFASLRQGAQESGAPVRVYGPVSQASFLTQLGLEARLQKLLQVCASELEHGLLKSTHAPAQKYACICKYEPLKKYTCSCTYEWSNSHTCTCTHKEGVHCYHNTASNDQNSAHAPAHIKKKYEYSILQHTTLPATVKV